MRPKPMPVWLRNRVAYFFLGIAALVIAVNTVVIGLDIPVFPYVFAAIAILAILAALWMTLAPVISDEEFMRQRITKENQRNTENIRRILERKANRRS